MQVVALRAELMLELAALQPADAVLAADRAPEPQRELEQLVARRVRAALLVGVVGREEERRMDVAVTRMAERQARDAVADRDLERLARDVAKTVERHRDVLAVRAAALGDDRERDAASPAPELGHLRGVCGRVHRDGVLRERLAQLARDARRLGPRAVGLRDHHERSALRYPERIRAAAVLERQPV